MSGVKRHPVRGFFAGLLAGLGAALLLIVTSQIALGTLTPIVVIVIGIVAGVLWAVFGPVRRRRGSPAKARPAARPRVEPAAEPVRTAQLPPEPAAAEPEAAEREAAEPKAATPAGAPTGWSPTHVAPPEGLTTYAGARDGGGVNGRLDPGLPVQVVDRQGDWACILCSNGWAAWVDGSKLVEAPKPR